MPAETKQPTRAERAQRVRDLGQEVKDIRRQDQPEVLFQESSPAREPEMIYSMVDGEPISIPWYMLADTIQKTLPDGTYMFTTHEDEAPTYRVGEIPCFLSPKAPEHAIVAELGLGSKVCPAEHLASAHSKRIHALRRHKDEWAAFQEYIEADKERLRIEREEKQLAATLALAEAATGQTKAK